MNIKVNINAITRIVDSKIPIEQVYKVVEPIACSASIHLCPITTGAGYLQWILDGNEWLAFKDLDENDKTEVAQVFTERRKRVIDELKGASLAANVLTVPSDEFLFVRKVGTDIEIALAGWAYRYPERASGLELNTWRSNTKYQEVNIIFTWDNKPIPNMPFMLEGQPRYTDLDGVFHVDRPLPVGKVYSLHTSHNVVKSTADRSFILNVEQGKSEYNFDLTQWFDIDVIITVDDQPHIGSECTIEFGDHSEKLITDNDGHAQLRLPLKCDSTGNIALSQPICTATYDNLKLDYSPSINDNNHTFRFDIKSVTPPHVPEKPKEEADDEQNVIPSHITIEILDYEGYPVVNMPLILKTRKSGTLDLRTDEQGKIYIPSNIVSDKDKLNISFTVTPEYQETHDIHYYKNKKK